MAERVRDSSSRRWRDRPPVIAWTGVGLAVILAGQWSSYLHRGDGSWWRGLWGEHLLPTWVQFDSWEYLAIARDGYTYRPGERSNVVFFPLYALAVRAVSWLGISIETGLVVVSLVAGLGFAVVVWRWLGLVGVEGRARALGLGVVLVYPYAWFLYGVAYADSLFLLCLGGAFVMAERGRFAGAAVLGAFATAGRPTGLALIPGLLILALERSDVLTVPSADGGEHGGWWRRQVQRFRIPVEFRRDRFRPRHLLPLGCIAGVGAYGAYLGVRWGDPLLFATNQEVYHPPGWFSLFKGGLVGNLVHWTMPTYTLTVTLQAAIVLAIALCIPAVGRRFGWGYGVYLLALVTIPTISSADYLGSGRYMLAAFPLAGLVGEWLAGRPTVARLWFPVSAALLLAMTWGFSRSMMLS